MVRRRARALRRGPALAPVTNPARNHNSVENRSGLPGSDSCLRDQSATIRFLHAGAQPSLRHLDDVPGRRKQAAWIDVRPNGCSK